MLRVDFPVAPPLTWEARHDYVKMAWQRMPWEQRLEPHHNMSFSYRDAVVQAEYDGRLHSFFPTLVYWEARA